MDLALSRGVCLQSQVTQNPIQTGLNNKGRALASETGKPRGGVNFRAGVIQVAHWHQQDLVSFSFCSPCHGVPIMSLPVMGALWCWRHPGMDRPLLLSCSFPLNHVTGKQSCKMGDRCWGRFNNGPSCFYVWSLQLDHLVLWGLIKSHGIWLLELLLNRGCKKNILEEFLQEEFLRS